MDNDQSPIIINQDSVSRRLPSLKDIKLTPIHAVILLFVLIAIILLIISIVQLFRKNPFGEQIAINNFDQYYNNLPTKTQDAITNTLHNIVSSNSPDTKLPKSGAKIRQDSTYSEFNAKTNIHYDSFIIDLESLKQSYVFQVVWSPDLDNPNLQDVGYTVVATCPSRDQLIYPDFNCKDDFLNSVAEIYDDPAVLKLPIRSANYSIFSQVKSGKISIIINDPTGNNHEAALKKLREEGINPDNYTIIYNN